MLKFITLALTIMLIPMGALAAPPLVTDDPGTPGPGNWEINTGLAVEKLRNKTTYQAPNLDLNYGVGEHIQLNYSVSWLVLQGDGSTKSGLSDSEAAVKWRFLDQNKQGIDLSVYPRFILNNPTSSADRGIVEKENIFRLPVQIEKKVGAITVNGEFGRDFHRENADEWLYGLALNYAEIKGLELLAEVFGTVDNGFSRYKTAFNLGVRYELGKSYSLLASAGRSFRSAPDQPDFLFYGGIQFRFGE